MSRTPTPEALAAADQWKYGGGCGTVHELAIAFDAHTKDLQNTIIRLTRELGEARDVEAGWLIEHEAEPKWLTLKPGEAAYEVCWTKESNDALRFARRVDADDYASTFLEEGPVRITEHRWG